MNNTIRCIRCDVENRTSRRFCAACGASLPCACPDCGFVNQMDERFCGGCGAALELLAATTRVTASGPSDDIGERRQATILFADLSGYTSLAARRDPEETHRILGLFFE